MKKVVYIFVVIVLVGVVLSCTESESENLNLSDLEIATAIYHNQKLPKDFTLLTDDNDNFTTFVHVRSTRLNPNDKAYELSTNNASTAYDWMEQEAQTFPAYPQVLTVNETELYFESIRANSVNSNVIFHFRVFKKDALDRDGVELPVDIGYYGKINLPLDKTTVKGIVEYLWWFTPSNNSGTAVLNSYVKEYETGFVHYMTEASIDNIWQVDTCGTVTVSNIEYIVTKDIGNIWKRIESERTFSAKRDSANNISLCD